MVKFARTPALLILLALAGLGAYAAWSPNPVGGAHNGKSLADLELIIGEGKADGSTWLAYAARLQAAARWSQSAEAYRRGLDANLPPADARKARFDYGVMLAQWPGSDAFFDYVRQLILSDARLACDLLDRPECKARAADARFAPLVKEAQAQAVD